MTMYISLSSPSACPPDQNDFDQQNHLDHGNNLNHHQNHPDHRNNLEDQNYPGISLCPPPPPAPHSHNLVAVLVSQPLSYPGAEHTFGVGRLFCWWKSSAGDHIQVQIVILIVILTIVRMIMINIVRLRITLLMVMVLTLIWDRSVGMVVLVMIIAKIILYWWFSWLLWY